ncbi:hypothetical protein ACOSQ2_001110 [Xanthoceras sorbifolium]
MGDAAVQACGAAPKWRWGAEKERSSCSGAVLGDAAVQGRFDCAGERRRQNQQRVGELRAIQNSREWRKRRRRKRMAKATSSSSSNDKIWAAGGGRERLWSRPRAAVLVDSSSERIGAASHCAG